VNEVKINLFERKFFGGNFAPKKNNLKYILYKILLKKKEEGENINFYKRKAETMNLKHINHGL
jgi:hypothetical protein